jgi:hypothetical protein
VTRAKLGGGYLCGGGGGGGASSSDNTTNNVDKRLAVDSGAGITGDNSSIVIQATSTDAGIVSRALDSIDSNNATNSEGFNQLLSAADRLFNRGENLIGTTQKTVADAQAQTTKAGTIDNKTLIVLAVAGAATVYAIARKK